MKGIHQEIQDGVLEVWNEAKPSIIKLSAHLLIFLYAAMCLAAMLTATYGLMILCDLLFVNCEIYVKVACIVGEVLISLYIIQFTSKKSVEPA